MAKYRVVHNNHYSFAEAVNHCTLEARLKPLDNKKQTVEFSQFVVRPLASSQHSEPDQFGNHVNYFEIARGLRSFSLSAIHTVKTVPLVSIDLAGSSPWESLVVATDADTDTSAYVGFNPELTDYARVSFRPDRPMLEAAFDLMQRINADFQYHPGTTRVDTTAIEAFQFKRGVCQDFSHVGIACLRSLALPVRYVSGYVDTKVNSKPPHRVAADASHAWFSVYDPEFDWVDFDPTNNKMPGETYITLAYGHDYDDVAPLKGQVDTQGGNKLKVDVDMTALS
jgi:transglutaminase-like putative cysteine protease